jgi:cell division protein FtsB
VIQAAFDAGGIDAVCLLFAKLEAHLEKLGAHVGKIEARIAELEKRLNERCRPTTQR